MAKKRTMKPASTEMVPRVIRRRFEHVTKVVDAVKPLGLDVTEDDGEGGTESDFERCAIARAACRQHHADHALVSKRVIYIIKGDTAIRYATNERLRTEISNYDRHKDFAQGHYVLPPKRPSERLGARRNYERVDPRQRHDVAAARWVPEPRVRDLNVADAAESRTSKKKKKR